MSVSFTLLALLGFVVLTAGTAVFVAAEFSLTALERSTVDANARTGGPRDKMVQRAHRTLSFQLSGAQVGISLTTLITGYLAEPLIANLLKEPLLAAGLPDSWVPGTALGLSLLIATSVSMVYGELVAQYLAVAHPLGTRAGGRDAPGAVLHDLHAGDPADQRHGQLDPAPAGHRAGRRAAVGPLTSGIGVAGPKLRPPRVTRSGHRGAGRPLAAVRRAHRRRTDDSSVEDRGAAGR